MPRLLLRRLALASLLSGPVALSACLGAGMQDPASAADAAGMGNGDIADITMAVNRGEIEEGRLATTRATSPDVRAFAERMVTEHTRVEAEMTATLQRSGITPRENERSRALREGTQTNLRVLGQRSGADFDREYMRVQVQEHRWLLSALDDSFIPGAQDERLRRQLQEIRGHVANHLRDAERILRGLGG